MAETLICGVCNQDPSKYKCPHCETRYCSIPCFKDHISEHEANEAANHAPTPAGFGEDPPSSPFEIEQTPPPPPSSPPPQQEPETPVARLLSNPQLALLLEKHPDLKSTLRRIYRATLHPHTLLETRLDEHETGEEDADALARRWGGHDMKRWTREKADERALGLLLELQLRDQAVAEFVEIVKGVLAAKAGEEAGQQLDVIEEPGYITIS